MELWVNMTDYSNSSGSDREIDSVLTLGWEVPQLPSEYRRLTV